MSRPRDLVFLHDTLDFIRALPQPARASIGAALRAVQGGGMPDHFDVLSSIGKGLTEIKTRHDGEAYRTFYVAVLDERVYVLDAIHKKSKKGRALPKQDADRLKRRYRDLAAEVAAEKRRR